MDSKKISFHCSMGTIWPHCGPDKAFRVKDIQIGSLWKKFPKAIRLQYYTDWDSEEELPYWFVIKDTPFDINELKAKRRYEITRANKFFTVCQIDVNKDAEAMYEVYKEAITGYRTARPPQYQLDDFKKSINLWSSSGGRVYGAFNTESILCGYAFLTEHDDHTSFVTLKTRPSSEKWGVNAAICYKILLDFEEKLKIPGYYISDGARNLYHQTRFQDYLQKYFLFRKAYCRLHVEYRPYIKIIINCVYPIKGILMKLDNLKFVHMLNAILKAEEIARKCK